MAPIGEGGMGQVYRAKDTRLDRMVAIKVLLDDHAADPDRRQRFEREARAVAAFSHPNVCAIFDVGHQEDVTYLVMEYLDGETLAARLERGSVRTPSVSRATPAPEGPSSGGAGKSVGAADVSHALPVQETLRIATALAEALAAAHRAGIVHRDLKPGNIMLTRTGVKVLDFGLARMTGRDPGAGGATMTGMVPLTGVGMLLGTLPYMSPEQVEGKEVDARSDIFALGSVIYEMATGRRAFDATGQASLIAAILERQPTPIAELQPVAPAGLDRIVRTCLEKDPDDRWQHASDIARQLRWLSAETESSRSSAGADAAVNLSSISTSSNAAGLPRTGDLEVPRPRRHYAWPLAAVTIATLVFGGYFGTLGMLGNRPAASAAVDDGAVHFQVGVPGATLTQAAVSPDGRTIALVGQRADSAMGLWLKRLDQRQADPLAVAGVTATATVVWSPDGRELAVNTARGLVAVRVDGGVVRSLTSEPFTPSSWGSAGVMLGRQQDTLRILNVATGQLTPLPDLFTISATFLPDGRRFLNVGRKADSGNPDGIYLTSLEAPAAQQPVASFRSIVRIAAGHLLFVRDGVIFAQPFNADRGEPFGEPKAIADGSTYFLPNGRSNLDAAEGTIAYFAREPDDAPVWVGRNGAEVGRLGSAGLYDEVRISPDGRRAVIYQIDRRQGTGDLWLRDLASNNMTRLTNDEYSESNIVWSPDSQSIVYGWDRNGPPDVYRLDVDRGGAAQLVYRTPTVDYPWAWLPGNRLLVTTSGVGTRVVGMDGVVDESVTGLPRAVSLASPDGNWLVTVGANASTGFNELSVQPLGRPGSPMMVSSGGGGNPIWSRDSRSLYYSRQNSIFVVRNQAPAGGGFVAGAPELVLSLTRDVRDFDVTPDGQRFLVRQSPPSDFLPLQVIVNWQAKLR
ncbi:MAG TPA: protein kinase [Vicinamibacterales bacterium]|nr:protein kinase [Vicinamibacterales bacterium]